MSETAIRDRRVKQRWAVPGGSHDRLVRFAKVALPCAAGVLIAFLATSPLERESDVSFVLDKNQVENAEERMRVEAARYVGTDETGRPFEIVAQTAVQRSSDEPVVDIRGMTARLALDSGPLTITAPNARYHLDEQTVLVRGPVRLAGPDGYQLQTRDVRIDLKRRVARSVAGVSGAMRLGQFDAGGLQTDLGQRRVTLTDGVRLKIVQGAVR
jgi:lipopolysaccharide export system protein LptC